MTEFESGTVLINQINKDVECANCGVICGKMYEMYGQLRVTLFSFRLTLDFPTNVTRVCQRRQHKSAPHCHNYIYKVISLTVKDAESAAQARETYNLTMNSQLWNGPFHVVTCTIPSPCVGVDRVEQLTGNEQVPLDLTQKPTATETGIVRRTYAHAGVKPCVTHSLPALVPFSMSSAAEDKRVTVIDSIVIKAGTSQNDPTTSGVSMMTEPTPSSSRALDSALITNEFELLSSPAVQNDDSLKSAKYLTRSKFSPGFQRISYAETDGRLTTKYLVPKRMRKSPVLKKQMIKKKQVKNSKRIVDRSYVKKRPTKRNQFVDTSVSVYCSTELIDNAQTETCVETDTASGIECNQATEQDSSSSQTETETCDASDTASSNECIQAIEQHSSDSQIETETCDAIDTASGIECIQVIEQSSSLMPTISMPESIEQRTSPMPSTSMHESNTSLIVPQLVPADSALHALTHEDLFELPAIQESFASSQELDIFDEPVTESELEMLYQRFFSN